MIILALFCVVLGGVAVTVLPVPGQTPAAVALFDSRMPELSTQLRIVAAETGDIHTFNVELAETPEQRERGLMFRQEMAADAGMLFDFGVPQRRVYFWMKNTMIPLDLIFINDQGIVAHIHENAVPLSEDLLPSVHPIRAVLEINGGMSKKLGLQVGDKIYHQYFTDKPLS